MAFLSIHRSALSDGYSFLSLTSDVDVIFKQILQRNESNGSLSMMSSVCFCGVNREFFAWV